MADQTSLPSVVFLGSFLEYSAQVLTALAASPLLKVVAVVTTPPAPAGRAQILTKNPVHQVADQLGISVYTPETLSSDDPVLSLGADFFVTAGYGKLLPNEWLTAPSLAALNLHFSLLPKYRGANPAEWAVLRGETETGVTVIEMSPKFDTGAVVSQAELKLNPDDTRETIYHHLYELGGQVLPDVISSYYGWKTTGVVADGLTLPAQPQPETSPTPYAKRLLRPDGYLPWSVISQAMEGKSSPLSLVSPSLQTAWSNETEITAHLIERATRALAGFPGLWTTVNTSKGEKRLKILNGHLSGTGLVLDRVQIEGQAAADWNQVKNSVS